MRREIDGDTLALLQLPISERNTHVRVRVANGDATLQNLSGRLIDYSLTQSNANTPIASLNLTFLRQTNPTNSLAPYTQESLYNRLNDGITYSPLLIMGRRVVFDIAITSLGTARPSDGSLLWYEIFRGVISPVRWPDRYGNTVTISCVDMAGILELSKSESEFTYVAGTSIEEAIRQVLVNNGHPWVTLYVPTPTGKVLQTNYAPGRQKTVWSQVWDIAQSMGALVWFWYRGNSTLELVLFSPPRGKIVADAIVPSVDDFSTMEINPEEIAYVGYLLFADSNEEIQTIGPVVNAESMAKYGGQDEIRRSFWIVLDNTSPVRTLESATLMLADALLDVADPDMIARANVPFNPFYQASWDMLEFPEDLRFYSGIQLLAPFGITLSGGVNAFPTTSIDLRGLPSAGARATWKAKQGVVPVTQTSDAVWLSNLDFVQALETSTNYAKSWDSAAVEVWGNYEIISGEPTDDKWAMVAEVAELGQVVTSPYYLAKPPLGSVGLLYLSPKIRNSSGQLVSPPGAIAHYEIVNGPSATGPSLEVSASSGPTSYVILWSGTGVELSINNGPYATPPASPITVTRPAAGADSLVYAFRNSRDGITATDTVTVNSIDKDTVPPDLVVVPVAASSSNTQAAFTASATRPDTGASVPVSVTLTGCSGTNNGSSLPAGVTQTVNGIIIVNRPAFGTAAGSVSFLATISGGGMENTQRTIPSIQQDTAWPVVQMKYKESDSLGTIWFKYTERGISVSSVQVQTKLGAGDFSSLISPYRTTGGTSLVNGGTLGAREFEHDAPLDPTRNSGIYGRLNLSTGDVQSIAPAIFDRDKNPNLLQVSVNNQTIDVLADAGDTLSLKAYRTDTSGWSESVDGISYSFHPPVPSGSSWPIKVVAYAAGVVDVTGSTPKAEFDVVVYGATSTSEPLWDVCTLLAPAIVGSSDIRLSLRASATPTGYTSRIWFKAVNDDYVDVTSDLIPTGGGLSTTTIDYTYDSGWYRDSPPGISVTLYMKCEILNGSSVVVATSTANCSYVIT